MVWRRVVSTIAAGAILVCGGPEVVGAAGTVGPDATETLLAHDAAVLVARELVAIDDLGGFPADSPASRLADELDDTIVPDEQASIDQLDREGHELLATMTRSGARLSTAVQQALEPLPRADRARLEQGQPIAIGDHVYLHAIDHLLTHGGRTPPRSRPGPPVEVTAASLAAYVDQGVTVSPAPAPSGPPDDSPDGPPDGPSDELTRTEDTGERSGVSGWAIVGIAAATGIAGWFVAGRRRTMPSSEHRASDLLAAGRSFAEAHTVCEVEALATERAMAITGAEAAVYVRLTGDGVERGRAIGLERFDVSRLGSSVVTRTVATGRPINLVATDPTIGERCSILTAPIVAAGHAAGVIVLTRRASRPFGQDDLDTLSALRPLVGSALGAAISRETIQTEAYVDALTGLANRRALDERLESITGHALILMVDIDRFKMVNDVHGHPVGDVALRSVAGTIRAAVADHGTVYRYGGEEFAIVLDTGEAATLGCVAERVRRSVESTPVAVDGVGDEGVLDLTVSIGTAWGEDPVETIARADIALYEAKRSGRNRIVASPGKTIGRHLGEAGELSPR